MATEEPRGRESVHFQTVTYNDRIAVCYTPELDGGGSRYGQDYVRFVRERCGRGGSVMEWCAGPGFLGFSLLAHGLSKELVLAQVNPEAVEAARATVLRNALEQRVRIYLSDNLDGVPRQERWDLVVGNPPHSGSSEAVPRLSHRSPILYMDAGWTIHRRFYAAIRRHLHQDSAVVVQENSSFSSVEDFRAMIHDGGLEIVSVEECPAEPVGMYYYIWSKQRS
jgi:methylase of polypeptide subunit release factors